MSQIYLIYFLNTAPDHFYDIPPLGDIPSSGGRGRGPGFLDAANELLGAAGLSLQYMHMHSSWVSVCTSSACSCSSSVLSSDTSGSTEIVSLKLATAPHCWCARALSPYHMSCEGKRVTTPNPINHKSISTSVSRGCASSTTRTHRTHTPEEPVPPRRRTAGVGPGSTPPPHVTSSPFSSSLITH